MGEENNVQGNGSMNVGSNTTPEQQATDTNVTPSASNDGNSAPANDGNNGNEGGNSANSISDGSRTIAKSERGSFVLRFNPRTGMNEVVSTMPKEKEKPENEDEDQGASQQQTDNNSPAQGGSASSSYKGDELLKMMEQIQTGNTPQIQDPQNTPPTADYTAAELQNAMRAGIVDESRIPVSLRSSYYAAISKAQQQVAQPPATPQKDGETQVANAQEYYQEVNRMAQERAMKEIGITKEELDVSGYTDDQELIQKKEAYELAVENNRAQILQAVDIIQRQQQAAAADSRKAYQSVVAFVKEMRQTNKDFDAIDKYMLERIGNMPHKEAEKFMPLMERFRNGTLSTADLPTLQQLFNDTRLEFYSRKTGVPIAPQVQKPSYVETPGNGKEPPKKAPDLSALGSMNKREKERAIGQLLGKMFSEE